MRGKKLTFVILLLALLLVGSVFYLHYQGQNKNIVKPLNQSVAADHHAQQLNSSMVFVGEIFWGRGINFWSMKSSSKYAFPFSGLSKSQHDQYNNWIGDMECPVTNMDIPYQTQVDSLKFNCSPDYLSEARKWFDVLTIANNHTFDNGQDGLDQTRTNLNNAGFQFFGDYHKENLDNICEVVSMKATTKSSTGNKDTYIPVAMCGYMLVVDQIPSNEELSVITKYSKVMPVIVMPHMGVEYRATAEPAKVEAYHAMIDAGADAVFATHPHVVQNSENYKGKLIQYSPGNFVFDQQSLGKDTTVGMGVGLNLSTNDQNAINIYNNMGSDCLKYKDDCLNQLTNKLKSRPRFDVSYFALCFMEPNNHPEPADDNTCSYIKQRADWNNATSSLNNQW